MRSRANLSVAVLAACLAYAALTGCGAPPQIGAVKTGDLAPAFKLKDLDGRVVDSGALKGKVVLLDFWATYCITCKQSIPAFSRLHEKYGGKGLAVLGITIDSYTGHLRDFSDEAGMSYPVLLDTDKKVAMAFGTLKLPETYLVGRDGIVRQKWIGYGPQHEGEISAAVEAALAGKPVPGAP